MTVHVSRGWSFICNALHISTFVHNGYDAVSRRCCPSNMYMFAYYTFAYYTGPTGRHSYP